MISSIPWSDNPRYYLRPYPAWHTLYRELSRERLPHSKAARFLGVDEAFIRARQRIPGLINRDKNSFSIIDLVALSIVSDFITEPEKLEFLQRMLFDYEGIVWQAMIGSVQGVDVYIAADFDKTITAPYFYSGPRSSDDIDASETEICLTPHLQKVLARPWPGMSLEARDDRRWNFRFDKKGYLQLEKLPLDAPPRTDVGQPMSAAERDEHGHKNLSAENFLSLDPFFKIASWWSKDAAERDRNVKGHVREILSIRMHPSVPAEIRKMFDLLKGGMVYGFFYRPLFSLLADQAYFIADAALHYKCEELGINDNGWNFKKRISALTARGTIHPDESVIWDAKLSLRDSVAHRTHRPLDWPPNEVARLEMIADDISRLFLPLFAEEAPL